MRVLWAGRDPELEEIDNGAFAQWLRKTDEELAAGLDPGAIGSCQSQVWCCASFHTPAMMSHHGNLNHLFNCLQDSFGFD